MVQKKAKEKLNIIKVFNGDRTILVEEFNTTFYKVRRALSGEINTDLSIQIREAAIKLGGEVIPKESEINTNRIKVYDGDRKALKNEFKTTYYTVQKALDGETNTLLSYQIRKAALKLGGREILSEEPEETEKK